MGTASKTETPPRAQDEVARQGQAQGQSQSIGSPVSNDAYNVITALQSKLEGLEAYRKYAKDGDNELWAKLVKVELPAVESLIGELERLVKDGKLRMKEPGRADA